MTEVELDAYIAASAQVLGLTIAPDWYPAVCSNLAITFRMAALVLDFPLPDEAEPAPVFVA